MTNDKAVTQTEEAPASSDNVVFVSPSDSLLVNLHVKPQRKYRLAGNIEIDEEVIRIQFVRGRYSTSDPLEIELLRDAPNNVRTIQEEVQEEWDAPPETAALDVYKDRFYEVSREGAA